MFIRVVTGVVKHLPDRFLEWTLALNIVYYGVNLAKPATAWSNLDAWRYMLSWGWTENQWGAIFIGVGLLRILALIINGTFAGTWYSAISPWVRVFTAAIAATVWFMVYQSVSATESSGKGIYQLPLVLDVWCSLRILYLMGRTAADKESQSGPNAGFSRSYSS